MAKSVNTFLRYGVVFYSTDKLFLRSNSFYSLYTVKSHVILYNNDARKLLLRMRRTYKGGCHLYLNGLSLIESS